MTSGSCKNHRLAFKSYKTPELQGMWRNGIMFTRCGKCSWIIKSGENHAGLGTWKNVASVLSELESLPTKTRNTNTLSNLLQKYLTKVKS